MLSKKILSLGLVGLLSANLLVGCGSEFDSTEYLSDNGKYALELERKANREYERLTGLTVLGEVQYKDKYIVATGKVSHTPHIEDNCMLISFDLDGDDNDSSIDSEGNNSPYPIRISIPKTMVDIKFNEGDTITVYGRFAGLKKHKHDKELKYWQISGYFLELGDTTNKDINTKDTAIRETTANKDVETAKKQPKKITVNVSEQATDKPDSTPKEDSKKSYQKDTNQKKTKSTQKKSNENTTKEEPIYDEYGYDQYGNYDPNKDLYNDREWNDDDYERWDDTHGDDEEPIQEDDNVDEEKDVYWCGECQCFSTYKHNHPVQEADDAEEYSIEETDDYYE